MGGRERAREVSGGQSRTVALRCAFHAAAVSSHAHGRALVSALG